MDRLKAGGYLILMISAILLVTALAVKWNNHLLEQRNVPQSEVKAYD